MQAWLCKSTLCPPWSLPWSMQIDSAVCQLRLLVRDQNNTVMLFWDQLILQTLVTPAWTITGPVTSLSQLGNSVWKLKNIFLYVWIIFHLDYMGLVNSDNVGKAVKVQHSLYMPLGNEKWRKSSLQKLPWDEGKAAKMWKCTRGRALLHPVPTNIIFYCLKFYGKHEGIIKRIFPLVVEKCPQQSLTE